MTCLIGLQPCLAAKSKKKTAIPTDAADIALPPPLILKLENLAPQPLRLNQDDTLKRQEPNLTPPVTPQQIPIPVPGILKVPAGFEVTVYAEALRGPTQLSLTPSGDVVAAEQSVNRLERLMDLDGNGSADEGLVFASRENGLWEPWAGAFASGFCFILQPDALLKIPYTPDQRNVSGMATDIIAPHKNKWQPLGRFLTPSPDATMLYFAVSFPNAPGNQGQIVSVNHLGAESKIYPVRSPLPAGLCFEPFTGRPYVMGAVKTAGGLFHDCLFPLEPSVDGKDTDVMLHSRGLVSSFTFYTGQMFPERYYNGVFATLRVSRNGGELGGKIVFIPFNDKHEPLGVYEDFLTGFVETSNAPVFWGEPSGIVMMQDGSLIFSDEANGRIYRISYRGPEKGRHYVSP